MNIGKKIISIVLCFIMLFGTLAVGTGGLAELLEVSSIKASAVYSVCDTIYYGTYPQTDVTDSLGSVLNEQDGIWQSYNYYFGTGSYEDTQMTASDYMRYKDVIYNGNKYRGVDFDSYRPSNTYFKLSDDCGRQNDNGYTTGKVYWFKYEPIKWRVLDPSSGFVMCDSIIDSQPYNNYIISDGKDPHGNLLCWGNSAQTYYASNYAKSSIREWLNNDFYNTAFSDKQKSNIKITALNNDCNKTLTGLGGYKEFDAPSTNDKVFLLSYDQVINSEYGFNSYAESSDTARWLQGSDYAKCQGLYNFTGMHHYWWLRSPGSSSYTACSVDPNSQVGYNGERPICEVQNGVVPALCLQNLKSEYAGSEIEESANTDDEPIGMRVIVNNTNLGYYVGDDIYIAVSEIVNVGNKKEEIEINKLSVKVSDSKVLSVSNMFKASSIPEEYPFLKKVKKTYSKSQFIVLNTKSIGYTYVALTNTDTGETRNIPFLITEDGAATYQANDLTSLDYISDEDLYGTSVNNIYLDKFTYKSSGSGYLFSMDIYNTNQCPGVVEVFDSNGKIKDIKQINKFENPTKGIVKALKGGWILISKGLDGSLTSLKSEAISKKTKIKDLFVPKDGYIRITCDSTISPACLIANIIDASFTMISFTKSAGKVIKGFKSFNKDDISKISAAVFAKLVAYEEYFKVAEEFQKKMSKILVKNVIDIEFIYNIVSDGILLLEDMLKTMGLTWDDIFKTAFGAGVSVAEDFIMDKMGTCGLILKIDFAVLETIDIVCQLYDMEKASTGKSAHNIYTPISKNYGVLKNSNVTVNTHSNVNSNTLLESYHVIKGNKDNIDLKTGEIYSEYELYEIALVSSGKYVQPRDSVEVSIISPYPKAIVARQKADGSWEIIKSSMKNGMIVFEVDHFCLFAVLKTNPTDKAKLKVPSNAEVDYAATVIVKATATGVPKGYYVAIYEGKKLLRKGSNKEVSYTFPGEFTSTKNITVKIIDEKENVQKDANSKELTGNVEIKAKSGFIAKFIAFFRRLFKALPKITVEPK